VCRPRVRDPRHRFPAAAVFRVCSGNLLEMYDFTIFGYYAAPISQALFPGGNAFVALMLAFTTFGAGFLMRPLGAVVLGAYADRHGRRAGLLVTLTLMSVGILSIACVPGYASIGLLAPFIVLVGRLLQGFSAGMELGGVSVYLAEIAPPDRKGFYVSWQSGSQQVAAMLAALIGIALGSMLSAEQMRRWGWRIPLLLGCLIIPVLFQLRRSLPETPAFMSRPRRPSRAELMSSLARHWRIVLAGALMVTMTTVSFYMITVYAPTFGHGVLHLSTRATLIVTLCIGASNLFWLPVMGAVSDRLGRLPLLLACTSLMLLTAYPVMVWLDQAPSFGRLLATLLWLSCLYGSYNGAMVVYLTEIIPADVRTTGFALAYSLATALFGGFTPAVSTFLIHVTHNRAMPGLWLSIAALCGLLATLASRRIRPLAPEAA